MTIEHLGTAYRFYPQLLKIAKSLHRLDEASCNYGLTPRQESAVNKLETRANEIVAMIAKFTGMPGLCTFHQSDPRGASLYVCKPEEANQRYYNRGIAIL